MHAEAKHDRQITTHTYKQTHREDDTERLTWFGITAYVHGPKKENLFHLIVSWVTRLHVFIANANHGKITKQLLTQIQSMANLQWTHLVKLKYRTSTQQTQTIHPPSHLNISSDFIIIHRYQYNDFIQKSKRNSNMRSQDKGMFVFARDIKESKEITYPCIGDRIRQISTFGNLRLRRSSTIS